MQLKILLEKVAAIRQVPIVTAFFCMGKRNGWGSLEQLATYLEKVRVGLPIGVKVRIRAVFSQL